MELKPYHQQVLDDLDEYLNYIQQFKRYDKAYNQFWEDKIGTYNPLEGTGMEPYKNSINTVPHVTIKVPTAGGKTFIASNAINVLFNHIDTQTKQFFGW